MPATTYNFTKTKVALDRLTQEITEVGLDSVFTGMTGLDDQIYLGFSRELTGPEQVSLQALVEAHNGEPLAPKPVEVLLGSPKTDDGKPVFDIFPGSEGFKTWIVGRGDNLTPTPPDTGRGTGDAMVMTWATLESRGKKTLEFQFLEPVEIHDGQISWAETSAWDHTDSFSVGIKIPASTVTINNSNTGNCNLVNLGAPGMDMIVPAAGNGTHNLTVARPVPDREGVGGYWDVSYNTGEVTVSTNPGQGKWNLFNFDVTGWMIRNICCGNPKGVFDIDVYKVEYFHQTWKLVWECTKESAGGGTISAWIFCFRRYTT